MSTSRVQYPCSICLKAVASNHRALFCNCCEKWVHIKCNFISPAKYNELIEEDDEEPWLCFNCIGEAMPYQNLDNLDMLLCDVSATDTNEDELELLDVRLGQREKDLIKEISELILINQNLDPDEIYHNCEYYEPEKFIKKRFKDTDYFSSFHLNIASLQAHIDELKVALKVLNFSFDVIGISESKIKSGTLPTCDITLENYKPESTPTEAEKGGTLLYISNSINYKRRPDLEVYVPKSIETTFVELIYPSQKNRIIGCIYKHHNITEKELVELMRPTLKQIIKERKPCQVMGDFNINLLSSVQNTDNAEFFNEMTSFNFMPLITAPTRVTSRSKSLIDNIFVNRYDQNIISGNILVGISDHMPQFSLIPEVKNTTKKNSTIFKRNFKKVNIGNLNRDVENINWHNTDDVHQFSESYLGSINRIIDLHAPLKKFTVKEGNLDRKPWITKGIQKSLSRKDKIYKKMVKEKDLTLKIQFEKDYKQLKQKIFNITRSSKRLHYRKFFQENAVNIRKLWIGVNEIIQCKIKKKEPINLLIDSQMDALLQVMIKLLKNSMISSLV